MSDDPFKDLQHSVAATKALLDAPDDPALWAQAHKAKYHISLKAVSDEYDRLMLQKLGIAPRAAWLD